MDHSTREVGEVLFTLIGDLMLHHALPHHVGKQLWARLVEIGITSEDIDTDDS